MAAYTSQLGAAGGATQGASTTELAQQHGVSRDRRSSQLVRSLRSITTAGRAPAPISPAPEETPLAGYTANAQRTAGRGGASGTISILA